jgi:hypothetical protein
MPIQGIRGLLPNQGLLYPQKQNLGLGQGKANRFNSPDVSRSRQASSRSCAASPFSVSITIFILYRMLASSTHRLGE